MVLMTRRIPFVEIDLLAYPQKQNDMLSPSDKLPVPQVFFNKHHVGGADDLMEILETWDASNESSPLDMYHTMIASEPDPSNPRLILPHHSARDNPSSSRKLSLRFKSIFRCEDESGSCLFP
jgi:glutaredoxin